MNSTFYPKHKTEFILISALKTTFIFNVNDFKTNIFIVNCIERLYVALYLKKRVRQVYSISVTKFSFTIKVIKSVGGFFINNNNIYISRIRDVKNLKYMYTRIIFVYRSPSQELDCKIRELTERTINHLTVCVRLSYTCGAVVTLYIKALATSSEQCADRQQPRANIQLHKMQ